MLSPQQEKQLMFVAGGVVLSTVLAIAVLILGLGQIPFYLFAIIAIALGFYLAYTLSKEEKDQKGQKKK